MTGDEFHARCMLILGDNYITWENEGGSPDVLVYVKKLPNSFQRVDLKTDIPAGIRIRWILKESDYPITIDTN